MRHYLLLFTILLLYGCGGVPTTPVADQSEQPLPSEEIVSLEPITELETGILLHRQGAYQQAVEQLKLDIENSTSTKRKLTLKIYLFDAMKRTGQLSDLSTLDMEMAESDYTPGHFFLAQLLDAQRVYANDPQSLIIALNNPAATPTEIFDELDLYAVFHQMRAQAYLKLENYYQAANEYLQRLTYLKTDQEIADNQHLIWQSLANYPVSIIQSLIKQQPQEHPLSSWLDLVITTRTNIKDTYELTRALIQWQIQYPANNAHQLFIEQLISHSEQLILSPKRIAVLLPMTSKYQKAAIAIRDGILAAYFDDSRHTQVSLRFYDTYGDITVGMNVYRQAIEEGAEFILGPLDKDIISAILEYDLAHIPTLALNMDDKTHENIYMFSLLPEDEAIAAAEKAWSQGYLNAAILLPDSSLGHRLAASYKEHWQALGGKVVSEAYYNAKKNDFAIPIKAVLDIDDSEDRRKLVQAIIGEKADFTPRRRDDIETIFISAFPRQARLIKPQLRFHQASDLPVIATSHLYSGSADKNQDRDMNGIVFGDMPWLLKPDASKIKASARLQDIYQGQLQRLVAMGMDAYELIQILPLLNTFPGENYQGQSGLLNIRNHHKISRHLTWAQFRRGVPVLLREQLDIEPLEQTVSN